MTIGLRVAGQRAEDPAMTSPTYRRGLSRLMLKAPDLRPRMADGPSQTPELLALYESYEDAAVALDGWRRASGPAAADRVSEYEHLIVALEADIRQALGLPMTTR